MTNTSPRTLFGAIAFLAAVAAVDATTARAASFAGDDLIQTVCGVGANTDCGYKDIMTCETTLSLDANIFNRSGGFQYTSTTCKKSGELRQFKDFKLRPQPKAKINTCGPKAPSDEDDLGYFMTPFEFQDCEE